MSLHHNGFERRYLADLPSDNPAGAPLLIALHDAASSGEALRAMTRLSQAAGAAGLLTVYPSSAGILWDNGRSREQVPPLLRPRDDVGFLAAVIDDAAERFGADVGNVTLVGFGAGGAMALEVACQAPELVRRVAVVAALLWEFQARSCQAEGNLPQLLFLHGSDDNRFPIGGGTASSGGVALRSLGLEETLDGFAARSGCRSGSEALGGALRSYQNCQGGEVAGVVVRGAGHHWLRDDSLLNPTNVSADRVVTAFASGAPWQNELPARPERLADGPPRNLFVYAPASYDPTQPTPLVVVLHGRPGNGPGIAFITDMNTIADEAGFLVAYPEALNNEGWNYIEDLPGYNPISDQSDVAFMRNLADELAADFALDPARLFITGFSNGGFMTQRLACEVSDRYAAFAFVGATFVPEYVVPCAQAPTAPVLFMHGTQDVSIPWDGLRAQVAGRERIATFSALETILFWTTRNLCVFVPTRTALPASTRATTRVVRFDYRDCLLGSDVIVYVIENGGHNWPGVPGRIGEAIAGNVNTDIHASREIWRFFEEHPLRGR